MRNRIGLALLTVGLAGCADEGPTEVPLMVTVDAVLPSPGSMAVDPMSSVVVHFSRPMQIGAEAHMDVHRGDAQDGIVAGQWSWSANRTVATFVPAGPLVPGSLHTVHLGGGLIGADGEAVFFEHCIGLGGAWVGGGPGNGWRHGGGAIGPGWMHGNGSYGIGFGFTTAGTAPGAVIASVSPAPGATGVNVGTTVVIEFTDAMPETATLFVDLHAAGSGTTVPGTWVWDAERRVATFTPSASLLPRTAYVIHVGGLLVTADDEPLDLQYCHRTLGGEWVDGTGPVWGVGHGHHGGPGWQHPNGTFGVIFHFTTG